MIFQTPFTRGQASFYSTACLSVTAVFNCLNLVFLYVSPDPCKTFHYSHVQNTATLDLVAALGGNRVADAAFFGALLIRATFICGTPLVKPSSYSGRHTVTRR